MTVQQEHAQEWPPCWGNLVCRLLLVKKNAGIQMHMVWANARQGRQVLPIVKVVLHLPCPERRTPVARPLAMSQLPDGPPAGRKRRRQSVCRGLENLSRGTLGDSLWRHGKT